MQSYIWDTKMKKVVRLINKKLLITNCTINKPKNKYDTHILQLINQCHTNIEQNSLISINPILDHLTVTPYVNQIFCFPNERILYFEYYKKCSLKKVVWENRKNPQIAKTQIKENVAVRQFI